MKNRLFGVVLLAILSLASSCDPDMGNNTTACESDFDQKAMFTNLADNLIVPAFKDFESKVAQLSLSQTAFTETPNQANLETLRADFITTYTSFQAVAQYNFGPAKTVFFRSSLNNFPLNIAETQANIQAGMYDFEMPDNYDKGFPALDYLLYGLADNDTDIVNTYIIGESAANHIQYLEDVVTAISFATTHVADAWQSTYRDEFVNNTGTAAGTSLSLIINDLNENYELTKRDRLGIPSGVLTLGFTNPEKVEAPFSGLSKELLVASLEASEALFKGAAGQGLDDYLADVNARKNDQLLTDVITNQLASALEAARAIEGDIAVVVEDNLEAVTNAYAESAKNVVPLKTDMPSVLCVSITYIDNPSDSD